MTNSDQIQLQITEEQQQKNIHSNNSQQTNQLHQVQGNTESQNEVKNNPEEDAKIKKERYILIGTCCLYLTIVVSIQVVLVAVIVVLFKDGSNSFDSLLDNWNEEVVTDFYIPLNDESCGSKDSSVFKYQQKIENYYFLYVNYSTNLQQNSWPGTTKGCLCTAGNYFQAGACCNSVVGVLDTKNSCCFGEAYDENPSKTFDHWGVGSTQEDSIRLCAKRLEGYSFHKKAPRDFSCKENEQMCGGKDKVNENYMFCIPKESKCPIQEIYFQQNQQGTLEKITVFYGTKSINLYVLRDSPKLLPLSQFKVSNAITACTDEKEAYIPEQTHSLDRRNQFCERQESQYEDTIFEIDQARYFLAQGINVSKEKTIKTNSYNFHLLQNNFIDIKIVCRDQIQNLYDNNDILQKLKIFCMALLAMVILNIFFLFTFNLLRQELNECTKFMLIYYIIRMVVVFVCIIFCAYIASVYITQQDFLDKYQEQKCFDQEYDDMISRIKKKLNKGLVIGLILILIFQILTDGDILIYLVKKYTKFSNPNIEKYFLFCKYVKKENPPSQ